MLLVSSTAFSHQIIKCPAPDICNKLYDSKVACEKNHKKCDSFVSVFKKILPKYDCRRKQDTVPVPAAWLCSSFEDSLQLLSTLKNRKAKKLFGSKELRQTLDGNIAEVFYKKSEEAGKNSN